MKRKPITEEGFTLIELLAAIAVIGILIALLLQVSLKAKAKAKALARSIASMEIVPGVGVGPIKFGMKMGEVKRTLGEPDRARGGPLEYLSLGFAVLPNSRDGTVGAIMMGDTGGGQLVERFKGATEEGIKMKSTRQEIVAAYGQPENAEVSADGVEELRYYSGRTQYVLRDGRVVHITLRR